MSDSITALAHKIASKVTGTRSLELVPVVGLGSVNTVFRVETAAGRCVLRLNPDCRLGVFEKERWCIEQAVRLGIPSPTVMAIGSVTGAAYMAQTWVESQNGAYYIGDTVAVWEQLGQYMRCIHRVGVLGFGETLSDAATGQFSDTWQRFVGYNIDSLSMNDPLLELGVLTVRSSLSLRQRFSCLLETPLAFGLNHGDLALRNTLIAPDGTVVLLDWGCAEAQVVPHFDLIELVRLGVPEGTRDYEAFCAGYGLSAADRDAIMPDLRVLRALRAVDKLRWGIDRSPGNINEFAQRARSAIGVL